MPSCGIVSCSSSYPSTAKLSFFKIPSVQTHRSEETKFLTEKRRNAWLRTIKRDLSETERKSVRICEKHFLSGRPATLEDENNPDWVPCQNLGYNYGCALKRKSDLDRFERLRKKIFRNIKPIRGTVKLEKSENISTQQDDISFPNVVTATNESISLKESDEQSSIRNLKYLNIIVRKKVEQGEKDHGKENDTLNVSTTSTSVQTEEPLLVSAIVQTEHPFLKDASTQTGLTSSQ